MSYNIKTMVLDADMAPIADANIVEIREDGKVNQVRTDKNGLFSISVPSKDSQIKISHIGYITEQFKANDTELFSYVQLEPDLKYLDPVTVNANKKSDNTIWWMLLGLATAGAGYYFYKKNQPKKVKV